MLNHLRDLLKHMAWADARFFHAWSEGPREDEELRERWTHVLGTATLFAGTLQGDLDLDWKGILSGEVPPPWLDQPLKGFGDLKSLTRSNHGKLAATLEGWDEAALARVLRIPWFPEPPCAISAAETCLQAVLHTQHHRGQCLTRLKDKGGKAPNVDYIIWLWKGRPPARWG